MGIFERLFSGRGMETTTTGVIGVVGIGLTEEVGRLIAEHLDRISRSDLFRDDATMKAVLERVGAALEGRTAEISSRVSSALQRAQPQPLTEGMQDLELCLEVVVLPYPIGRARAYFAKRRPSGYFAYLTELLNTKVAQQARLLTTLGGKWLLANLVICAPPSQDELSVQLCITPLSRKPAHVKACPAVLLPKELLSFRERLLSAFIT